MVSSANQMHLVGPFVPQLGQIFAKRVTGSSQVRQVVRLVLAIMTSSSGRCGQVLVGGSSPSRGAVSIAGPLFGTFQGTIAFPVIPP
jgi:hypothetical protein